MLGARRAARGARRSVLGARRSALGARCSVLGARYSVLGARCSVLGARCGAAAAPSSGGRVIESSSHRSVESIYVHFPLMFTFCLAMMNHASDQADRPNAPPSTRSAAGSDAPSSTRALDDASALPPTRTARRSDTPPSARHAPPHSPPSSLGDFRDGARRSASGDFPGARSDARTHTAQIERFVKAPSPKRARE